MGRDVIHDAGGACETPATPGISITFGPESMATFVFYGQGGQKGRNSMREWNCKNDIVHR